MYIEICIPITLFRTKIIQVYFFFIYLTEEGSKIANNIYERHTLFTEWLIRIGVNPKTAEEDACQIEHAISDESFAAIKKYIKKK